MTRVDFEELTKTDRGRCACRLCHHGRTGLFYQAHKEHKSRDRRGPEESQLAERIFNAKTDAVSRYKTGFNIDNASAPTEIESATKFYSFLINLLQSTGFEDAAVVKANETKDSASFKVSGEAAYFSLLELFASFRQSSYLMRVLNLELTGQTDGYVTYSYTIECRIAAAEPPKTENRNN